MKTGIELIAEERQRQIEKEGWTAEHDAEHKNGELADAAACYAMSAEKRDKYASWNIVKSFKFPRWWPWDSNWWKPTPEDRVRELQKAGALIAAEIDRLNSL